jgi:benzoate 4-monooxygenase
VLQPLFLSKLRSFPGPVTARLSSFWLTKQCRHTRRSTAVMDLHLKHGDFVRVAPNSISINDPAAVQQIYSHKSNFAKGDFYDAFLQVRPVIFNARDISLHQRKRKYLNPAFSARALSEFEPSMDVDLLLWKRKLLAMTELTQSANLDFAIWSE